MQKLPRLRHPAFILFLVLSFGLQLSFSQEATTEACPATTEEENKALARRFFEEAMNQHNPDVFDELVDPDHIQDTGLGPAQVHGLDEVKQWFKDVLLSSFPDFQTTVEQVIAEGDLVALRFTHRGNYQGETADTDPPGKEVTWTGMAFFRMECGRIAQSWFEADHLSRLQQMGVVDLMDDELTGRCSNWQASQDRRPPTAAPVHVTAECELPTPGYTVELRRREPQGINPRVLLLELVLLEPTGVVPDVIAVETVEYIDETGNEYDQVHVVNEGVILEVEVYH